mmetsp:Transcript_19525/g.50014  ORF Transcript_19525/g.50014 Transcript_19525/m.50014 type:complete len:88 (+) Transcript_19525:1885-2148(+)
MPDVTLDSRVKSLFQGNEVSKKARKDERRVSDVSYLGMLYTGVLGCLTTSMVVKSAKKDKRICTTTEEMWRCGVEEGRGGESGCVTL